MEDAAVAEVLDLFQRIDAARHRHFVHGTARAMAALYQMMLAGGELNGTRIVSPRTLQYAIRNHTGDRIDEFMGMPMHRGLGPHLRGTTENIRGLGATAHPTAFGHGRSEEHTSELQSH